MRSLSLAMLKGYQYLISPLLGKNCRFYPSCSCYVEEAIKVHGISKGVYLGFQRLLKCHPFHAGGYDPVPQSEKEKS